MSNWDIEYDDEGQPVRMWWNPRPEPSTTHTAITYPPCPYCGFAAGWHSGECKQLPQYGAADEAGGCTVTLYQQKETTMTMKYALLLIPSLALAGGHPPPPKPQPAGQHQQQGQQQAQVAEAKQSQTATASQSQSADNAGNQQVTRYDNPRQVASSYAPSIAPTVVCATSRTGGLSASVVGVSAGKSGIDLECETRETARLFAEMGLRDSAALIACSTVAAQRAFNGRPCPLPQAVDTQPTRVEVRLEDVRAERAEQHGFKAAGK